MNEFRGSSGAPAARKIIRHGAVEWRRAALQANAHELRYGHVACDVERAGGTTHNMRRVAGHAGLRRASWAGPGFGGRTDAHLDVVDREVELRELSAPQHTQRR